ncbi:MAG TPA: nucleotidyltransferase family protein [Clostridia bacterium]|nr:nucleotidyltransferase family protein [Clostridia bacterium]
MINDIDTIILAGSVTKGPLEECVSADYEALISIEGKTMVEYVVEALKQTGRINRIVIVGPPDELSPLFHDEVIHIVPCGSSIDENVLLGMEFLNKDGWVLIASSDIPLLTPVAVNDFLDNCTEEADFYYPVVTRDSIERAFGDIKRTYVNIYEGMFTGGNILLFKSAVAQKSLEKGRELINLRKSPLKLAGVLGLGFLLKFVTRSLKIAEAEKVVSRLLGVQGRAVISEFPEIGVDVDKPADLEIVSKKIKSF